MTVYDQPMIPEGIFRRRRLPHWDVADATFFVTACLADSIPARGLNALRVYRRRLDSQPRPKAVSEEEWEYQKHKLVFAKFDSIIDDEPASRLSENRAASEIVQNALFHFAGNRYWLLAYVIMPSHFHWVFQPTSEYCELIARETDERTPRELIMHSIKSFTGTRCNQALGLGGMFWQDESYDHCVRNHDELLRIIAYVENNPVKAGLVRTAEESEFSSARIRVRDGIHDGEPLVRLC